MPVFQPVSSTLQHKSASVAVAVLSSAIAALACSSDEHGAQFDPRTGTADSTTSNGNATSAASTQVTSGNAGSEATADGGTTAPAAGGTTSTSTAGPSTTGGNGSGGSTTQGSVTSAGGDTTTAAGTVGGSGGAISGDDPAPGAYGERAMLPEANSEMAVAELDGLIYVLGGYPSSRETQTTVQVYDPSSDSWDIRAPLPIAIHHPVAASVGKALFSLGGQTDAGDIDRTLVYDPELDTWSDRTPMPTARGAGAAAVIDDKIYVVGGRPPAENEFEVYDVSDDGWEELPPLPLTFNQRNHLAAAAIDGKIYVAGGRYNGGSFSSAMTDSLDIYDPATEQWSQGAPMLRARGGNNGVAAYGCFYTWGGEGSDIGEPNNVFPDHDVYDPNTDSWMALAPLPTPVHGVTGAVFLDGLIYIPGGGTAQGGSSGSAIFQVYRPAVRCD